MKPPAKPRRNSPLVRWALVVTGWFLIIISPIIGAIPGPGFIILFPIGLALVLRNSGFGKRLYIRIKHRFPDLGRWTDWALRRRRQQDRPPLPTIGALWRRWRRSDR